MMAETVPQGEDRGKTALLLLGSPRTPSNSASLGNYVCERLANEGWEIETAVARKAISSPERLDALCEAVDRADLTIVAFPLYVDHLPAPLIRVFEEIATRRKAHGPSAGVGETSVKSGKQRLVALVNCGFPEVYQNELALSICEIFAHDTGFEWAGGLALGGGEMLGRKPLAETGGLAQGIRAALDTAAAALAAGQSIPPGSVEKMAKPAIPRWLYILAGNWGWKQQAKRSGVRSQLHARPYA